VTQKVIIAAWTPNVPLHRRLRLSIHVSLSKRAIIRYFHGSFMDYVTVSVLVICFIATLIRAIFGFGESLVAVPLLLLVVPLQVAVPLSVLVSVLIALVVVVQDHSKVHVRSAKWLILFALPGIPLGLVLLVYAGASLVKLGLGILLVAYSLYGLWGKSRIRLGQDNFFWLFVCGFFSGFLGGAYGLNGPPLVIYGNMRQWNVSYFRATLQAYFLPVSALGVIGYAWKGLLTTAVLHYFILAVPVVLPAIFLGRYLHYRLNHETFFMYVYTLLILLGVFLVVNGIR
jgi:uncharacterized membrane protein YfcA